MGEVRAKLRLVNEGDRWMCGHGKLARGKVRKAAVEAVVDTGAVMMLLPQDLVEKLGLETIDKRIVLLADGRKTGLDRAGTLSLTVAGREIKTDCLVGPPGCVPLVGQLVLEGLDLIVDPVRRTVTPRPESPYLPTLNLFGTFPQGGRSIPCPEPV